jgi:hypothetical protein
VLRAPHCAGCYLIIVASVAFGLTNIRDARPWWQSAEILRRALTRNADGSASGALGKLLDILLSKEMP